MVNIRHLVWGLIDCTGIEHFNVGQIIWVNSIITSGTGMSP